MFVFSKAGIARMTLGYFLSGKMPDSLWLKKKEKERHLFIQVFTEFLLCVSSAMLDAASTILGQTDKLYFLAKISN